MNKKLIARNAGLTRNNQVLKAKVDKCYRNAAAMLRIQIKQADLEGEHVPVRLRVMPERLEALSQSGAPKDEHAYMTRLAVAFGYKLSDPADEES